jgi:nitroreductase
MQTIQPQQLINQLKWRYATKQFDPARKISAENWAALEECLILTPSSYGLQPWKFILVQDPKVREALLPATWGQKQVVECSHFVVLAIQKKFGEAGIDSLLKRTVEVRGGSLDKLNGYREMMIGTLVKGPAGAHIDDWSARQVYIALGNLMTSAAMLGVDTCPMEGFDPPKYDEILGLGKQGLASAVACALGYRAETDKYAQAPKVRFQAKEVFIRI